MKKDENLPIIVYTPESQLRTPLKFLSSMFKNLKASRELSWRLFLRDISAQYRNSLLGISWAFLPPIVMGLIFIILQSNKIINFGETDIPYPVFALVGTTLWQVFSESLNAPLKSVTMARPMLVKINFPREALIVSAFYQIVFNILIKCPILAGICIIFKVHVTWGLLFVPLALLTLVLLGMSLGLLLTPIGTLYTDISSGLTIFTQLWFFLTPVVYPPPQAFPYSLINTLNPVSPILMGTRDLITKGYINNIQLFLIVSSLIIIVMMAAWTIYRLALPIIIERMGA